MEDHRPSAGRSDVELDEDEALPDWSQFAKLVKSHKQDDGAILVPFIPKRGEKDFEPIVMSSDLPASSKAATLSQHQLNLLNSSRNALFTALSSGSRHHSSKVHNSFTWRPDLDGGRAVCDAGASAYGIHFLNMGRYHPGRKQIELFPEEALYLCERGVIELWRESGTTDQDCARVPMSVQQAWAELIGTADLTVERFQVYAYLKRLGYILDRARNPPSMESTGVYDRKFAFFGFAPAQLVRDLFLSILETLQRLFRQLPKTVQLIMTRALRSTEGRVTSLLSGRRWATYDQIFGHLQIIPTGHDRKLGHGSAGHQPSVLTPMANVPPVAKPALPDLQQYPYQTFFNIYKPVTKYRKSAPPPPDFRVVVINAVTTPLPDMYECSEMFETVPFTPSEDYLLPPPRAVRAGLPPPPPPRAPNPRFKPRIPPPPSSLWQKLQRKLPFFRSGDTPPTKKPVHYQRLKVGRRGILVAVVDNGTISILRFSESEFGKLSWNGTGRAM